MKGNNFLLGALACAAVPFIVSLALIQAMNPTVMMFNLPQLNLPSPFLIIVAGVVGFLLFMIIFPFAAVIFVLYLAYRFVKAYERSHK